MLSFSLQTNDTFDGVNLQTKQVGKQNFTEDFKRKEGLEFLMRW